MDHTTHRPLAAMDYSEDTLVDATVYGPGDETIGTIAHVHGTGASAKAVIEVGGFLGLGTRSVSVDCSALNFMRDEDGTVHATTTWTRAEVKALPEHTH